MFRIIGLACLLGAATYIHAADPQDTKQPVQPPKAAVKSQPQAPQGGMVVFVDPVTGKIRQPDASEIGAIVGPTPPQLSQPASLPTFQPAGGGVGIKLPSSTLLYMVAGKTPDGKLTTECVDGDQAAASRVQSGEISKQPATSKTVVPAPVK